jgi:hypothetical protein
MDKIFVDNLEPNIALVVKTLKDIADKQESNSDIVSLLEKLEQKDSQAVIEAIKSIPATESVSIKEAKDILDTLATLNDAINAIKLDKVSINEAKSLLDGLSGIEKAVKAKDLSVNIDTSTIESGLSEIVRAVKAIEYPEFALPEAQIEALKPYEDYATREGQEEIVGAIKKIKINVSGGGGGGFPVVGLKAADDLTRINPATEEGLESIVSAVENITIPAPEGGATEAKQLPDNHQVSVSNFPGSFSVSNFPSTTAVSLKTVALTASGNVHVPTGGKKTRVFNLKFSLSADMTDVSFRWASGGTDFIKFLAPKAGGYYGTNIHPEYLEGATDAILYCVITGTGTVQINLEYLEI